MTVESDVGAARRPNAFLRPAFLVLRAQMPAAQARPAYVRAFE